MTYVRKSPEQMIQEIGFAPDCKPTIEDRIITQQGSNRTGNARIVGYIHCKHQQDLRTHVPSQKDFWELFDMGGSGAVIGHLATNSYAWGYDYQEGKEIIVRLYFGKSGVVIQCQDFGKGFDATRELELLMHPNDWNKRNSSHRGIGLNLFRNEIYEATLESSQTQPTGTIATVKYLYRFNNEGK